MTPKYLKIRILGNPPKNVVVRWKQKKKMKVMEQQRRQSLTASMQKLQIHENIMFKAWKSLKFSFFPWNDDIVDESFV